MDALETLYLGDGVKTLERSAFSGNTTLKHVVLGTGLIDGENMPSMTCSRPCSMPSRARQGMHPEKPLVADLNSRKGAQVTPAGLYAPVCGADRNPESGNCPGNCFRHRRHRG